ncbi:hypothetical protein M407DRAFT_241451 [Tulasnella calospora MUT 4182]|uniref:Uncharacterized protein n=1 Tax=Tulasnella calospora MUT 4182 TaxID=1051891 RepID=A0A0C3QV02_9AGAM|nr:hypothetical protein M407DRAFT_241451 [Tulasnella calospora MUT 4182]
MMTEERDWPFSILPTRYQAHHNHEEHEGQVTNHCQSNSTAAVYPQETKARPASLAPDIIITLSRDGCRRRFPRHAIASISARL